MTDKDRVIELIESSRETDFCDFKREFYHDAKKGDMIKDILSFANSIEYGDKYIIFNIDNETHQLGTMESGSIPDISEINGLLREYCEPYIGVEVDIFPYENSNVAYIKIPVESSDRPYLVKKDYSREGKIILQQGQIFLRRNADNFKANRMDLDKVYESRIKRKLEISKKEIVEKESVIKNKIERYFVMEFTLFNNAKYNYLIDDVKIFFKYPGHCFSISNNNILITDINNVGKNDVIIDMPFSVEAFSTIKKSLRFKLSSVCIEQIKRCITDFSEPTVWMEFQDVKKQKICSETKECSINFIK